MYLLTFFIMAICIVILLTIFSVLFDWYPRWEANQRRKKLIVLPVHSIKGTIESVDLYDTGKTQLESVPAGYSQHIPSGETVWHYRYESTRVYDGYIASVRTENGMLLIRSMPKYRSKFQTTPDIPQPEGIVEIQYVTDENGVNYLMSVSQN